MSNPRFWRLPGGQGGLLFALPTAALLVIGVLYFSQRSRSQEMAANALRHQESLLHAENEQLRAQVDKLQTELAEVGSLARKKEEMLKEKEATLETTRAASEQRDAEQKIANQKRELTLLELHKNFAQNLKAKLDVKQISLRRDSSHLVALIPLAQLFNSGEEDLKPEAAAFLASVATLLKGVPDSAEIRIVGHSDNTPLQGALAQRFPSNLELSAFRAAAVARALTKAGGLPAQRLIPVGRGEAQPLVSNDAKDGKNQNRRIEIIVDLSRSGESDKRTP